MSREEIFKCDVCKKPKGETNHWFLVKFWNVQGLHMSINAWHPDDALLEEILHLCGEECVQKKVSEFLSAK